ncbi:MAG TPA: aldehyde dehydrogenase family protein [Anaerolineales bacterium]|nr:aldehyde dehydrogenase family protein [Anaerolineales bacterium]
MLIDGRKVRGESAQALLVVNPATEETLAEIRAGGRSQVASAVEAAKRAFSTWRRTPAVERAHLLHQVAASLREHHDELARLLTQEEGKPLPENDEELVWTEDTFDYYAELGRHERGRVIPPGDPDQFNFVLKEPYGVVGCIVPWNYPLLLMAWKVAPALAAGNTVVIKPSELTPLTTLRVAETAFAGLPPGVVNVVAGTGPDAGEALVTHPDVRVIAFTGSLVTGQRIAHLAAPEMKKLHLELGGKDPMVIGPDVETDLAVRALAYAALINTGQVCTSTERVYVPQERLSSLAEELSAFVETLRLGDGLDPETDIGPMIREPFRQRVEAQIQDAVARGARLLSGGVRPAERRGFFFPPTVLVDVDHEMQIMRDETFGPVIPLMPYRDFDEAIRLANDSPYGLGATLMSHDARLVKRFFEEVDAGTIWINDPLTDNYAGPFGGMKMSGLGRELGQEGLDEFFRVKHIHWDMVGRQKDYWFPYGTEARNE